MRVVLLVLIVLWPATAQARWVGTAEQWADLQSRDAHDDMSNWFNSLSSKQAGNCCSNFDGRPPEATIGNGDGYGSPLSTSACVAVVTLSLLDCHRVESRQQAIVGETPNLAARLQSVAEPNSVVIAESTRRLVGNLFELEDLGAQELKGICLIGWVRLP
jgi:Adenylate and Guanylate cyclase catalytic domain